MKQKEIQKVKAQNFNLFPSLPELPHQPKQHKKKQIKEISPPLQAKPSHSQPIETNPDFKKAKKREKTLVSIKLFTTTYIYKYTHTCMHARM